jgi:hypothetical protein
MRYVTEITTRQKSPTRRTVLYIPLALSASDLPRNIIGLAKKDEGAFKLPDLLEHAIKYAWDGACWDARDKVNRLQGVIEFELLR